ncbi:putative transmembrane protein [Gregarina niphandrodes]|uniref:Transmembrane protein n=1 Tax=Gregarina niphandrodes TaxID=110365 RepID=A0A023AZ63_GRENI|nr:putative transmembrane protein [Gregarina niphandrodes]EZG43940.1 putative transmembrane protein [Gregarina niphandrodes]|eukprot:XP_011132911.1 putative transmembrane protein [Gregarina niphandrodes]
MLWIIWYCGLGLISLSASLAVGIGTWLASYYTIQNPVKISDYAINFDYKPFIQFDATGYMYRSPPPVVSQQDHLWQKLNDPLSPAPPFGKFILQDMDKLVFRSQSHPVAAVAWISINGNNTLPYPSASSDWFARKTSDETAQDDRIAEKYPADNYGLGFSASTTSQGSATYGPSLSGESDKSGRFGTNDNMGIRNGNISHDGRQDGSRDGRQDGSQDGLRGYGLSRYDWYRYGCRYGRIAWVFLRECVITPVKVVFHILRLGRKLLPGRKWLLPGFRWPRSAINWIFKSENDVAAVQLRMVYDRFELLRYNTLALYTTLYNSEGSMVVRLNKLYVPKRISPLQNAMCSLNFVVSDLLTLGIQALEPWVQNILSLGWCQRRVLASIDILSKVHRQTLTESTVQLRIEPQLVTELIKTPSDWEVDLLEPTLRIITHAGGLTGLIQDHAVLASSVLALFTGTGTLVLGIMLFLILHK